MANINIQDVLGKAQDAISVRRVYGEPYEKDGVTVIPAAKVGGAGGGGGGGGGDAEGGRGEGGGVGYGLSAQPVGAYVISNGEVRWEPALDLNSVIMRGQIAFVILLFLLRGVLRSRAKARARALKAGR